jgi:hypothetical protein
LKDAELDPVIPIRRFASDDDAETMRGLTLSYSKRPLVAAECFWHFAAFQTQVPNGRFSNRPVGVKRFQTIHHYSVDVAQAAARLPHLLGA